MANSRKIVNVKQWGVGANLRRTDCGVACTLAVLHSCHIGATLNVDDLTRETSLLYSDNGLAAYALETLGRSYGLDYRTETGLTVATLKQHVDDGHDPVILILYRDFARIGSPLEREDYNDQNGYHWVVFDGYDDADNALIDDPDVLYATGAWGQDNPVALSHVDAAIAAATDPSTGKNRTGVICYGVLNFSVEKTSSVHGGAVNLRLHPGYAGSRIATIPDKTVLELLAPTDNLPSPVQDDHLTWQLVRHSSDKGQRIGYVANQYLAVA